MQRQSRSEMKCLALWRCLPENGHTTLAVPLLIYSGHLEIPIDVIAVTESVLAVYKSPPAKRLGCFGKNNYKV